MRGSGMGGGIGSVLYSERDEYGTDVREYFVYNPAVGHVVATLTGDGGAATVKSTNLYEAFGNIINWSSGLSVSYYAGGTIDPLELLHADVDADVDHDDDAFFPPMGVTDGDFCVKWEGFVTADVDGTYVFQTETAGGAKLTVDGSILFDTYADGTPATNSGSVALSAGQKTPVILEANYTNASGPASARLLWKLSTEATFVVVAAGALTHGTGGDTLNNRLANTKERDFSIGLDNHGFRYYDPETGRYTTRDLIGYASGTLNVYGHVNNNPVNTFDPLGLNANEKARRVIRRATGDYRRDTARSRSEMIAQRGIKKTQAALIEKHKPKEGEEAGEEYKAASKAWAAANKSYNAAQKAFGRRTREYLDELRAATSPEGVNDPDLMSLHRSVGATLRGLDRATEARGGRTVDVMFMPGLKDNGFATVTTGKTTLVLRQFDFSG